MTKLSPAWKVGLGLLAGAAVLGVAAVALADDDDPPARGLTLEQKRVAACKHLSKLALDELAAQEGVPREALEPALAAAEAQCMANVAKFSVAQLDCVLASKSFAEAAQKCQPAQARAL